MPAVKIIEKEIKLKQVIIVKGKCPIFPHENFLHEICDGCAYKSNGKCRYQEYVCKVETKHTPGSEIDYPSVFVPENLYERRNIESTTWTFPCAKCGKTASIRQSKLGILVRGSSAGKCRSCKTLHTFIGTARSAEKRDHYKFAVPCD